eukprot:2716804-Amphidinium_carterae.1
MSVEDYLKNLRRENRRTGEQVARIALTIKEEKMTKEFMNTISYKAREIVIQQSRSAARARMSPKPLPADDLKGE